MGAPDLTVTVGPDPDNTEVAVQISHAALDAGCYVIGDEPQQRTTLLHDWCVQWAERGHGFWYVHPRGPEPRELLARLPADRLEDVVWIDYGRSQLADSLDVPPVRRVGVDPFAGPASDIDPDALITDPVIGRCANWLAAAGESTEDFDWNVARVLETLLPLLVGDEGADYWEVTKVFSSVSLDDDPSLLFEFVDGQAAERQLTQAHAYDDTVFRKVSQCLGNPRDPFASNPLLGESTYDIENTLTNTDIVLVTGALPEPGPRPVDTRKLLGTHVLIQTLVRRLWERAQTAPADATPTPLLLDGITPLSPEQDTLIPELIEHAPPTPLVPVLAGPEIRELPERLTRPIVEHVDTQVQYSDPTGPGQPSLPSGDIEAMERAIEREQESPIAADARCWISTGNAGYLTGNPQTATPTRAAQPSDPPATRHGAETVAQAITESVTRHGAVADWLTDEMVREERER